MTIRVLSIDGGGMRGIYTSTYLAELESAFARRRGCAGLDIGKGFRLIVGSSTGAIIGCGLAHGVAPSEMVKLYKDHGARIFPKRMPSTLGMDLLRQLWRRPSYLKDGDESLRSALAETFGATTIRQIWDSRGIALAIPAVNMATYRAWVFKTPHDPTSDHRDDDTTLVDVCLASSAAPLFRSLAVIDHNRGYDVFADGGLWANNPVLVALLEALRIVNDTEDDIYIYALGSCGKPEGEVVARTAVHRGLLEWKFGGEAAKVSIAAQEFAFDMMVNLLCPYLKRRVHIIRFPAEKIPGAMLQYLDLDETRAEGLDALMRHAQQDAHMTNSEIQRGTQAGIAIQTLFDSMPPRATLEV
jgi:patatin-like phospholipase/acyl hydrolase